MNKKKFKTTLILTILGLLATTNLLVFYYGNNTGINSVSNTPNLKTSGIINVTVFSDDFESGLSKWASVTGLWHKTNSSSSSPNPYRSYESAMWFGQNSTGDYDTGSTEKGNLTSITFDLTTYFEASLEFYHWRECERRDTSFVYISTDGSNWDKIYETVLREDEVILPWEQKIFDISSYCGNASVTLRFYFDTFDDRYNDYPGWLVDDVKVTALHNDVTDPVVTTPSDIIVEFGVYTGESISWTATDLYASIYTISLAGTGIVRSSTTWTSGAPINFPIPDGFDVGDYIYTVEFTDLGGNSETDSVTFTVEDNLKPIITDSPIDFNEELGQYTGQTISWTATDPHPNTYTISKLGTGSPVAGPTAWLNNSEITYSIPDVLSVGDHIYTVNFTDDYGNFETDSVTFTVEDTTDPIITVSPSDFSAELGYTGQFISWTATDPNPYNYTVSLQGTGIVEPSTEWTSGNGIIYYIPDGKSLGDYIYTVNFTDDDSNFATDSVTFTVGDATKPNITIAPSNFTVEMGYTGQSLSWTATDLNRGNYTISLEGVGIVVSSTRWNSSESVLYNIPPGFGVREYVYTINFTDEFNNFALSSVTFTVEDTTDPIITIAPSDFSRNLGYSGVNISWTATDINQYNYTISLQGNGTVVNSTAWTSGVAITYNITDGLGYGIYIFTVNFTDVYNNSVTDSVSFTVGDSLDPVIISSTNNFTVEFGYTGQTLSWNVTDVNPFNYTISLQGNGTVVNSTAWVSGTLVTYNIPDGLALGNYVYVINFTDTVLQSVSDTVMFTVEDTTNPVITIAPSDFSAPFDYTGQTLTWTATDSNPGTYTVELQGTGIVVTSTAWTSGNSVVYAIPDGLTPGVYLYSITFIDTEGNSDSDLVSVTIEAQPTTPPSDDGLLTILLIAGIGGGAAVVVTTVVVVKKKRTPSSTPSDTPSDTPADT